MILGFLTKYRDYRARVHTGPGGDTSTSYIMVLFSVLGILEEAVYQPKQERKNQLYNSAISRLWRTTA